MTQSPIQWILSLNQLSHFWGQVHPIDSICRSLVAIPYLFRIEDTSTLALVCLALDPQRALSDLGVTP